MTAPVALADLDIDPIRPDFSLRPDYWEVFARLRAEAPIFEVAPGIKLITRYEDIRAVSRDPERFCSGRGVLVNDPLRQGGSVRGSILHMDPPEHGEWRRILNREFTSKSVLRLEGGIRDRITQLLDAIAPGEPVELVDALSAPLPVMVIAELLGVPESRWDDFRRWSDATILASDGQSQLPPEAVQDLGELVAFLGELLEEKAAAPQDDVVSLLVQSEVGGRRLPPGELLTFAMSLLVAGNETTRHLISGATLELATRPEQRRVLVDDPSLIPSAVEEFLRWVTPIQQFARTATGPTELAGVPIDEGDFLVLMYGSGNRDEAIFGPTADQFDVTRPVIANLAFGFGPHLCLGAALARLEARLVFEELLARFPDFELAGEPERLPSSLVRGLHSVPIRFG